MVDDSDDPVSGAARGRHNKLKYMQVLQGVADRTQNEVLIDLNDLEAVSLAQGTDGRLG